jgi:hypothetical protein
LAVVVDGLLQPTARAGRAHRCDRPRRGRSAGRRCGRASRACETTCRSGST